MNGSHGQGETSDCSPLILPPPHTLPQHPGVVVPVLTFLFWGAGKWVFEISVLGINEKWG